MPSSPSVRPPWRPVDAAARDHTPSGIAPTDGGPVGTAPTARTARWTALAVDALLIVLFATLGRRTHESGLDPAGILWTALPFLLAWAVVSLATRPRRSWARPWPAGVVVWLGTVAGGLLLRVLLGDTAAFSFQLVTAAVLGVFLLGRRCVTALLTRPRPRPRS